MVILENTISTNIMKNKLLLVYFILQFMVMITLSIQSFSL